MWHFGKYGFTSAVAYDPTKDRNKQSKFRTIAKQADTHILVRARVKADLEDLKRVVPNILIEEDKGADYAFRAVITRAKFKKFLALHVDDIDYDSHFKEVVRDNSTQPAARYSAMMSIWSSMANLQPSTPWSGGEWWSGYGGSGYAGTGSKSGYVSPYGSDAKTAGASGTTTGGKSGSSAATVGFDAAAKDVKDFMEKYVESGGDRSYRGGEGPMTGFTVGDRVICYNGEGTVEAVEKRSGSSSDMVTVKIDGLKGKADRTAKFMSNFLCPADLPDLALDEEEPEAATMDDVYSDITTQHGNKIGWATEEDFQTFDEDAFEFYTRLQEKFGDNAYVSLLQLNDTFDELVWEQSSDDEKLSWVAEGTDVPTKYADEREEWFKKYLAQEAERESETPAK